MGRGKAACPLPQPATQCGIGRQQSDGGVNILHRPAIDDKARHPVLHQFGGAAVSPDDVKAAAAHVFRITQSVTSRLLPARGAP